MYNTFIDLINKGIAERKERYKVVIQNTDSLVIYRVTSKITEYITVIQTSERCMRLMRVGHYNISDKLTYANYRSFTSQFEMAQYIKISDYNRELKSKKE